MSQYIYLIKSKANSDYKIGVSKNPKSRIKSLQTGSADEIEIVAEYLTPKAYQIEKILHRRYSYAKKKGEWFDLSIKDEANFLSECNKIDEMITCLKSMGNIFI